MFDLIVPMIGACLVLFFVVFHLRRAAAQRKARPDKRRTGFFPSYASMGNALQTLQVLAQPEVRHIIEEKQQEDADEDDEGDPDDPAAYLEQQMKKIRNGEKVDRLTVRLR